MSSTDRAVAGVVAALVVIGVVVVLLGLGGDGDRSAQASPSASAGAGSSESVAPTSSAGAAPSSPSPGDDARIAALEEIEDQVIAIRGLPAAEIGAPEIITRAELAVELEQLFEEDYPPEDQERDNMSLRALGLLEPGQDVAELQLQLLGEQVLGFYDDVEKRMVVVSDAGLDAEAKLTYAHEYTHALQDAAFGLDALETDVAGEDDRSLARTAMIEGDATVTMLAWAIEHLPPEELMEIGSGAELPDTTGIPAWMVNQLQFPYTGGLTWAAALTGDPLSPTFTELDAAYGEPPNSTEQIIHLDAWQPREAPVDVEVVDLASALGDGWEEVDATPLGEATIRIMLEYFGVANPAAVNAAAGWGGDRAVIASGPDEGFAVAWRLAWDTAEDAAAFADAYEGVIGSFDFPATVTEISDTEVLVVHASDVDVARRTQDAADG